MRPQMLYCQHHHEPWCMGHNLCLAADPGRAHGDGRAAVESIQSLIDTQPGGREPLFTTIGLLAAFAEAT